jgi:hypothetical protein
MTGQEAYEEDRRRKPIYHDGAEPAIVGQATRDNEMVVEPKPDAETMATTYAVMSG